MKRIGILNNGIIENIIVVSDEDVDLFGGVILDNSINIGDTYPPESEPTEFKLLKTKVAEQDAIINDLLVSSLEVSDV